MRRELAEEAGLDIVDLTPFGTEYASDDARASVPIAIYVGRWDGDPRELHRSGAEQCLRVGEGGESQPEPLPGWMPG